MDDDTVRALINLGADIRFKPVSIKQIHTVVRELLDRRQSEGAEPGADEVHERAEKAIDRARKAAADVGFAAERARAQRARKKQ